MPGRRHFDVGRKKPPDPRVVGGRYKCGYWGYEYTVLAIDGYKITCRLEDNSGVCSNIRNDPQFAVGEVWSHMTGWDWHSDKIISLPAGSPDAQIPASS